jgi:hypothetical protein
LGRRGRGSNFIIFFLINKNFIETRKDPYKYTGSEPEKKQQKQQKQQRNKTKNNTN